MYIEMNILYFAKGNLEMSGGGGSCRRELDSFTPSC